MRFLTVVLIFLHVDFDQDGFIGRRDLEELLSKISGEDEEISLPKVDVDFFIENVSVYRFWNCS